MNTVTISPKFQVVIPKLIRSSIYRSRVIAFDSSTPSARNTAK